MNFAVPDGSVRSVSGLVLPVRWLREQRCTRWLCRCTGSYWNVPIQGHWETVSYSPECRVPLRGCRLPNSTSRNPSKRGLVDCPENRKISVSRIDSRHWIRQISVGDRCDVWRVVRRTDVVPFLRNTGFQRVVLPWNGCRLGRVYPTRSRIPVVPGCIFPSWNFARNFE